MIQVQLMIVYKKEDLMSIDLELLDYTPLASYFKPYQFYLKFQWLFYGFHFQRFIKILNLQ
jgi:hypothetical protein